MTYTYPHDMENEFRMDRVLSGGVINQDSCSVSGGRLGMAPSHISQYVPFEGAGPRQLMAGVERDYANAVWWVAIDAAYVTNPDDENDMYHTEDVMIDDIFTKYSADGDKIRHNDFATTYVVSHGMDTGQVYVTEVPYYMSHHTLWGFKLIRTKLFNSLRKGMVVRGDKVLAHGPSRLPDGNFAFGQEVNCSYLGTFNTNEDGCGAGMSVKDIYRTEMYNVTEIFVESNQLLTNKHGNADYYKPLPSVGDKLNAKGLIAVKRDIRKAYGLNNMTKSALQRTIRPFDMEIHALPFAEVIEVEVISGPRAMTDDMPSGFVSYMDSLVNKRRTHLKHFMDLDRQYAEHARQNGMKDYLRHPSAHIPMVAAERELGACPANKAKPSIIINESVCSGYYVRIVTRKINVPQLGHKFTGLSAEKFVICDFKPDNEMPTDKWGRHSLFNANPVGVVNRNNPSQLFQQYTTDACFHTRRVLLEMAENGASYNELWDYLVGFYELASPNTHRIVTQLLAIEERPAFITNILQTRIDLEDEIGDDHLGVNIVGRLIDTKYRPPYDVVTFTDGCGNLRTSKYKCRVSNKYIWAMEKIGKHASASSIPLRQNCGFAAKQSSQQKRIAQISTKPSRVFGESEFRAIVANGGPKLAKRLITILSNPRASKLMADEALQHLGFMNIEDLEYRSLGMNVLRHLLLCYGIEIEYIPEVSEEVRVLTPEELGEPL